MILVFQNEIKRLFRKWIGWVFSAILLLTAGIVAYINHLSRGYTTFGGLFGILLIVSSILIPVAASLTFTGSHRTGEDAWFFSLPLSRTAYFAGKYLALFGMFLIPTAVTGLLPLIFSAFGAISLSAAYTAWLGYVLGEATLLAICSWIALQTDRRLLSASLGIFVCVLSVFTDAIIGFMKQKVWVAFLLSILLFLAIAAYIWIRTKKRWIPASLTFAVPTVVFTVLAFAVPRILTDRFPAVLRLCSPFVRSSGFFGGHFDVPALVYGIAVIGFFLFLMSYRADLPLGEKARRVLIAGVVLVLLAANIGVLFLPFRVAYPNVTGQTIFRLSNETRTALMTLDGDVTLHYLSDGGKQNVDRDIYSLVVQYAEASSRVKVKVVDIRSDPKFADLDAQTRAYIDQSVLVSGRRQRLIPQSETYYYAYTESNMTLQFTATDYQQTLAAMVSSGDEETLYAFVDAVSVRLSMESLLTNAIFFAASENAPKIALAGNQIDHFLEQHLAQCGYDLTTAADEDSILAADAVLCNLTSDLSESTTALLSASLAAGGKWLIMADASASMPNLNGVLTEYGVFDSVTDAPHVDAAGSVVGTYRLTADAETENGGRIVLVGANVSNYYNAMSGGGDFDYLLRAINWLTDFEGKKITVKDPSIPTDRLSPSATMRTLWAILLIVLTPAAVLTLGAVTRYRRRQKAAMRSASSV